MSYISVMITLLGLVSGTCVVTSLAEKMAGSPEQGTVIPAENRLCVECRTFEFMEQALQDINMAAYDLDSQTEKLLVRTEDRGLCVCIV